jgi:hypothetical protein
MIDIALTMEFSLGAAVPDERWGLGHQVVSGGSHARRRGGGCGAGRITVLLRRGPAAAAELSDAAIADVGSQR